MKAQTENYPRTNLISLLLLSILVSTTTYAGRYASSNLEIEEIERDMESISKKMDACTAKMQSGASCKEIIIFLEKRNLRELADIQHRASYYWHNSEDTESARTEIHRIINNGFTASYDRFVDTVVRVYQGDGYSWTEDCLGDLTKAIGPEVPDKKEANDKSDFCRSMEKWHIFYNSGKRRTYKISEDLANRTNDNLFSWQVPVAIQVGAERWNHEANTGVYQYIGTYDGGGDGSPISSAT